MARFKNLNLDEILRMLGELTPLEETRAYRELVARGAEIGRRDGREEGRKHEIALIRRQLQRRLGTLTAAQETGLAALGFADLEAWLARH